MKVALRCLLMFAIALAASGIAYADSITLGYLVANSGTEQGCFTAGVSSFCNFAADSSTFDLNDIVVTAAGNGIQFSGLVLDNTGNSSAMTGDLLLQYSVESTHFLDMLRQSLEVTADGTGSIAVAETAYQTDEGGTPVAQFNSGYTVASSGTFTDELLFTPHVQQMFVTKELFIIANANSMLETSIIDTFHANPEPGTVVLLATGLAAVGVLSRKRKSVLNA